MKEVNKDKTTINRCVVTLVRYFLMVDRMVGIGRSIPATPFPLELMNPLLTLLPSGGLPSDELPLLMPLLLMLMLAQTSFPLLFRRAFSLELPRVGEDEEKTEG